MSPRFYSIIELLARIHPDDQVTIICSDSDHADDYLADLTKLCDGVPSERGVISHRGIPITVMFTEPPNAQN